MADPYLVLKDLSHYMDIQQKTQQDYANSELWWKKAILNTANSGFFSSDRTIHEYNDVIWRLPKLRFSTESQRL
jgi:starch phosphorylase